MYIGAKDRLCCIVMALCLFLSVSGTALADGEDEVPTERLEAGEDAAWTLYELGLMQGKGEEADGTPIFGLEDKVDRASAVTMLVRILGGEKEALATHFYHPFADSNGWMSPYVGYAYFFHITEGTSTPSDPVQNFSPDDYVTANAFLTWILRALGYDVDWENPRPLADQVGLVYPQGEGYYRADMALTALSALDCAYSNGVVLRKTLVENGVIPALSDDFFSSVIPLDPNSPYNPFAPDDPDGGYGDYDDPGGSIVPSDPIDPGPSTAFDPDAPVGMPGSSYTGASGFTPGPVYSDVSEITLSSLSELETSLASAARGHADTVRIQLPGGSGASLASRLREKSDVITDMCDAASLSVLETGEDFIDVAVTYTDAGQAMALSESRLVSPSQSASDLLDAAVNALTAAAQPGGGDLAAVLAIHDYLLEHTVYGSPTSNGENAAGPLLEGYAASGGYARAFRLMCYLAGIDCTVIHGTVVTSNGQFEDRMWNKVCLDGAWYNVDLSMDDGPSVKYNYFLISDASIGRDHFPNTDRTLWPASASNYAVG